MHLGYWLSSIIGAKFTAASLGRSRRECLDHVIVMNQTGVRRVLKSYFKYYERTRTHLSLENMNAARPSLSGSVLF